MTSTELYILALEFTLDAKRRLREAEAKHEKMGGNALHYGEYDLEHDPVACKARDDVAAALPRLEKAFDNFLKDRIAECSKSKE